MKEIKLDIEWAMLTGEAAVLGVGNAKVSSALTTAREMGSIQTYLTTNFSVGITTGAVSAGTGATTMTAGVARAFAEPLLTGVLSTAFTKGGNPKLLFMDAANKGLISGFTGGGTHYVDKDNKKLINSVDVYVGDFHTLKVQPSRQIAVENVIAIDPEYVACAELRPVGSKNLSVTGDSEKRQILSECTLEVRNEKAHCIIADTQG